MDRAILARHGESVRSVTGLVNGNPGVPVGLTDEGRAQARELGRALAGQAIDLAVTSSFPRTIETADIALRGREVPRLVIGELDDLAFGVFEDRPLADYRAWVVAHGPEEAPAGGESRATAVGRWVRGFGAVLARTEPTVLVVGHGMSIRYLLAAAEDVRPAALADEVGYADPYALNAGTMREALDRLSDWCAAPEWPVAR